MLLAVLEKRAGLRVGDRDVFVNLVGGVAVDEPALDLAVAAAVISAAADIAVPGRHRALRRGRPAGRDPRRRAAPERLREAEALGFARCALAERGQLPAPPVSLVTVPRVADRV